METPTQWRQPAAQSSAWRSPIQSVQRLLFSFSYTDPEENVRTALTCNDPLSEAAGPEAAPRQPWDRQELLKRLRTFRCAALHMCHAHACLVSRHANMRIHAN